MGKAAPGQTQQRDEKKGYKNSFIASFFAEKADVFLPFPGRNGEISPRRFLFSCDTDLSAS